MKERLAGITRSLRKRWRSVLESLPNPPYDDQLRITLDLGQRGIPQALSFDKARLQNDVLSLVESLRVGEFEYRFAASTKHPTLYSSVYACLTRSLFGELEALSESERRAWANYFDEFQSPDGVFRDEAVHNDYYERTDSWGARHLVLHMIAAYAALGFLPRYPFRFLEEFMTDDVLSPGGALYFSDLSGEMDNRIMNVLCALQFERDFRDDARAFESLQRIKAKLWSMRNESTGMWAGGDLANPVTRSRAVQFAYHLYAVYFFDGDPIEEPRRLIEIVLDTQNSLGGFGAALNSSACEDIDSVDLLCRLAPLVPSKAAEVRSAIHRSLAWQLANQNDDGGFVFRRNEPFFYGHRSMSSRKNESALFPTWFRALSIAKSTEHLGMAEYRYLPCPGLQFPTRS